MGAFTTILSGALDGANKIINDFHASPEEKAAATQALAQIKEQATAAAETEQVNLNKLASDNIQTEEKSGGKLTAYSRPMLLYIGYAILAWNYILLPGIQFFHKVSIQPFQLPTEFWFLFSSGYLGYVVARSVDKQQALPGASGINLPFGISMTNTSSK